MNETATMEENFLGYSPDFKVLKSLAGKPTLQLANDSALKANI